MTATLANIKSYGLLILEDSAGTLFDIEGASSIDLGIQQALKEVTSYSPHKYKEERFTTSGSKELNISGITNFYDLFMGRVEYKVSQSPKSYKNTELFGDYLEILTSMSPSGDSVYLECLKYHTLVDPPSTLAGAVNLEAGYSAGDSSIVLDGLGTGTIKVGTLVYFTGLKQEYKVTADADITDNAATIAISPSLLEDLDDDTVVTFRCSTLTPKLEQLLPELAAAYSAINWLGAGRTAITNAISTISLVNASADKMAARVTQAIADLASGRTLVNTVPVFSQEASVYAQMGATELSISEADRAEAAAYVSEFGAHQAAANLIASYQNWGMNKLSYVLARLNSLREPAQWVEYPRG